MESINLVDIGPNDDLSEVIRKCNYNFKQANKTQISGTISSTVASDSIGSLRRYIDQKIEDINSKISNIDVAPPKGTYIYADYDPNEKWPGTTWNKVDEGHFIMSSGSTKIKGKKYGNEKVEVPLANHRHYIIEPIGETDTKSWYVGTFDGRPSFKETYSATGLGHASWVSNEDIYMGTTTDRTGGVRDAQVDVSLNPEIDLTPKSIALPLWHRTK